MVSIAELSQLIVEFSDKDEAEALHYRYEIQVGEQRRSIELLAIKHFKGKMVRMLQKEGNSISITIIATASSCPNFYPMWQMILGQNLHWTHPKKEFTWQWITRGHGTKEVTGEYC